MAATTMVHIRVDETLKTQAVETLGNSQKIFPQILRPVRLEKKSA